MSLPKTTFPKTNLLKRLYPRGPKCKHYVNTFSFFSTPYLPSSLSSSSASPSPQHAACWFRGGGAGAPYPEVPVPDGIPGRFTPSNVRPVWDRVPAADLPSYICLVLGPGGPERTTPPLCSLGDQQNTFPLQTD